MTKQRAIDRAVVKITTVAESIDIPPVQRGILAAALRDLIEASSAEPNGVDPDYKLPCEVRLPPSMSIGKGCPLSTLMNALRHREQWSDPQDLVFQDERAMAMRRALSALQSSAGGHLVSNEHEHATYVEPPVNRK